MTSTIKCSTRDYNLSDAQKHALNFIRANPDENGWASVEVIGPQKILRATVLSLARKRLIRLKDLNASAQFIDCKPR